VGHHCPDHSNLHQKEEEEEEEEEEENAGRYLKRFFTTPEELKGE
jgi:hypothetical protein